MRSLIVTSLTLFINACTHRVDLSNIHTGMSRSEVVRALGEPPSHFVILGVEMMTYDGQQIVLENDTVVQVGENPQDPSRTKIQVSQAEIDSLKQALDSTWTKH